MVSITNHSRSKSNGDGSPRARSLGRPKRASPDARTCAARLVEVAPLVVRFIRAQMRAQMPGLTMAQFRAMSYLYRRPGCSLRALAGHLGVTPPTGSALVERLVARGVATRTPNAANRREVALQLTAAGRAQYEAATEAARRRTTRVLAAVPDPVVRRLTQDLLELGAAFAAAEVAPER
jgi:DNA-binding MarR family transcriptional regulator